MSLAGVLVLEVEPDLLDVLGVGLVVQDIVIAGGDPGDEGQSLAVHGDGVERAAQLAVLVGGDADEVGAGGGIGVRPDLAQLGADGLNELAIRAHGVLLLRAEARYRRLLNGAHAVVAHQIAHLAARAGKQRREGEGAFLIGDRAGIAVGQDGALHRVFVCGAAAGG